MRRTLSVLTLAVFVSAACGDDSSLLTTPPPTAATTPSTAAATTTDPPATSTTTLPDLVVPAQATVDRLEWEGRVTVETREDDVRLEAVATVTGAYASPSSHSLDLVMQVLEVDPESDAVDRQEERWSVVVIGEVSWLSEDGGPYETGDAGDVDYQLELLSTAPGGILPTPEMLADLAERPWALATALGRPAMSFDIPRAPLHVYAPLFGSGLVDDPLPGAEDGDLTLLLDPATGVVLRAGLSLLGEDSGTPIEVTLAFEVTAVDGDAGGVFPPGVDPFDLAPGLLPFADGAGRFRIGYPAGWSVDEDEEVVSFESPDGPQYATVLFLPLDEPTTPDSFVDGLLSDAPEVRVLERGTVESGGHTWVRLDIEMEEGGRTVRATAWLTVSDSTALGVQVVAPAAEWGVWSGTAADVFASFGLLGP